MTQGPILDLDIAGAMENPLNVPLMRNEAGSSTSAAAVPRDTGAAAVDAVGHADTDPKTPAHEQNRPFMHEATAAESAQVLETISAAAATEQAALLPPPLTKEEGKEAKKTETPQELPQSGILSTIEHILDWLPFMMVQGLVTSHGPVVALGCGTVAATFVIIYSWIKANCRATETTGSTSSFSLSSQKADGVAPAWHPKTLDVGQLVLFAALWILAWATEHNELDGKLLVLWFNPVTTGGMALIMLASILRGKPFILSAAESKMPLGMFKKLSTRRFFLQKITEMAYFWVKILATMTILISIQPILVCVMYGGDVDKDQNGQMAALGGLLSLCQVPILFYGLYVSSGMQRKRKAAKKRVKEVKQKGFGKERVKMYKDFQCDFMNAAGHRIRSLYAEADLNDAGVVLTDAFRNDAMIFIDIDRQDMRLNWFQTVGRIASEFNMVFGCFDGDGKSEGKGQCAGVTASNTENGGGNVSLTGPRCVATCLPVLSESQEEMDVFNTMEAWMEYGFEMDMVDFQVPDDDTFQAFELRKKPKHGLTKKPYIYVQLLGTDSAFKGCGYGRSLLKHITEVADNKHLPLVLETQNAENVSMYERYDFKVVDRVNERKEYVLMVRQPRKGVDP